MNTIDFAVIDDGKQMVVTPVSEQAKEAIKGYTGVYMKCKYIPYSLYDGFMQLASIKYNAITAEITKIIKIQA